MNNKIKKITFIKNQFEKKGYVITNANKNKIDYIKNFISKHIKYKKLSQLNKLLNPNEINKTRLNLFNEINKNKKFREVYFSIFKEGLNALIGQDLSMQKKINLNIQLINDNNSLLDMHADTFAGETPYEIITWLPLTDVHSSNSMYIYPFEDTKKIYKNLKNFNESGTSDILLKYKKNKKFLKIKYGNILFFSANLLHGNVVNKTNSSRVSLNCRFKNIYAPSNPIPSTNHVISYYDDISASPSKKIGDQFYGFDFI